MPAKIHLTDEQKNQIYELHFSGSSYRQIEKATGIGYRIVWQTIKGRKKELMRLALGKA